ncbi:hypothetical protein N7481_011668 [Penicillium waksmanii]|uniref:uncharacterized protein n=1 Tax=Penicillium waksmanii TaxID=69791 RepID=UPI0025489AF5|nr:uncharacterized protein N7481_011668 [Penicillium waksmanii]KAJ5974458.1 hypothetical protein N7481_011668 [Penicillium waksmanii]
MAPPRQRTTAIVDDSRSEASSGTREFNKATTNKRKTGANKDKAPVTSAPANADVTDEQPRVPWSDLPLEILHSYRHAHKLSTPSAYSNDYSRIVLSQGIGLRSPTALAARRAQSQSQSSSNRDKSNHTSRDGTSSDDAPLHKITGQDRVSKDQFALVVRKHFNSAGMSEQESIAQFLYTVREERRGRQFRLRFQP